MSYKLGQFKRAKEDFVTAQKLWKAMSGKDKAAATTWAAEARYLEGELIVREYEKVTLDVKPAQLEKALKAKTSLLASAEKVFESIADFNDPRWGTAAVFRIGQIYDAFAESLVNAATPKGLTEEQAQAYRDALDSYVVNIQDVAVQKFTVGYGLAIKSGVYDEYTAKTREALGRLAADKYPPERESRSKERIGDRPPSPDYVQEVAR